MSLRTRRTAQRRQRQREALHTLERIVGPRCKDFEPGCIVCQSYHLLDTMRRWPGLDYAIARTWDQVTTHPPATAQETTP